MVPLLLGVAVGGAAMYLLDPDQGRRRRDQLRERAVSARNDAHEFIEEGKRDLSNRAASATAQARSLFAGSSSADRELAKAVRAMMGRHVAHPGAVEVSAAAGRVTLSGPVLSHERPDFVEAVRAVSGVAEVDDRLGVYETAEGISELRERRPGDWAPGTRLVACAAGTTLALLLLRGGLRGLVCGAAGALLLLSVRTQGAERSHTSSPSA